MELFQLGQYKGGMNVHNDQIFADNNNIKQHEQQSKIFWLVRLVSLYLIGLLGLFLRRWTTWYPIQTGLECLLHSNKNQNPIKYTTKKFHFPCFLIYGGLLNKNVIFTVLFSVTGYIFAQIFSITFSKT